MTFRRKKITRFAELPEDWTIDGSPGLSISPDGKQLVLGVIEGGGHDIMLVEDFH